MISAKFFHNPRLYYNHQERKGPVKIDRSKLKNGGISMFDLMPFNRWEDNLFHYLDNLEKNFWGDLATNVSSFRTVLLDKGDKFVFCLLYTSRCV